MNRTRTLIPLIAAAVLLITPSLRAQQNVFVADVPFQFGVDNKTLPAGTYRLTRQGAFLHIENREHPANVLVLSRNDDASPRANDALVFDYVNGLYFFRTLDTPSAGLGSGLGISRAEKQAMEIARATPQPSSATTQVTVATGAQ